MYVLLQRAAKAMSISKQRLLRGRRNSSLPRGGQKISCWGDREGRMEGTGGADQWNMPKHSSCCCFWSTGLHISDEIWRNLKRERISTDIRLPPPPAAIASLVLIHLLKPWQQPGLKCRLKMFTCSEVKEQLRTKSRTRHAVAFEIGRVGSMWLRSRE